MRRTNPNDERFVSEAKAAKLYSPQLLGLAATLADYPLNGDFQCLGEASSRTCGSSIKLGIDRQPDGAISRIGMQVTACAVGQSSAAIMASDICGRTAADLAAAERAIVSWLEGSGPVPTWPGFDALLPARDHPGRHGALMLVWKAAREALSSSAASS